MDSNTEFVCDCLLEWLQGFLMSSVSSSFSDVSCSSPRVISITDAALDFSLLGCNGEIWSARVVQRI